MKFEGIQPDLKKPKSPAEEKAYQIGECVRRLGKYAEQGAVFRAISCPTWASFFELLTPYLQEAPRVLYFEEVQWLAHYQDEFFAEMKPFWDDTWRHVKGLRIVISGSSPSFIVGQLLGDKALYNRSQHEFHLLPFTLQETREFLKGKGKHEQLLAALCVGGIPEYLKQLKGAPSILQGLAYHSFISGGYFVNELERVLVSTLTREKQYEQVLEVLAQQRFFTREEIAKKVLRGKKPGGNFSTLLKDLEECGFINRYVPLTKTHTSLLGRYTITDEFLNFFFRIIRPRLSRIKERKFDNTPDAALPRAELQIILGFAFERWCRKNHALLATIMQFNQIEYTAGPFFVRSRADIPKGFQIDLMYIRRDFKVVICEVKYLLEKTPRSIYNEVAQKISLFKEAEPKYRNYTFETALICIEKPEGKIKKDEFFDHVITLDELFLG